jgi:hypothetical protein
MLDQASSKHCVVKNHKAPLTANKTQRSKHSLSCQGILDVLSRSVHSGSTMRRNRSFQQFLSLFLSLQALAMAPQGKLDLQQLMQVLLLSEVAFPACDSAADA